MERDGNDGVEHRAAGEVDCHTLRDEPAELCSKATLTPVLEPVDRVTEGTGMASGCTHGEAAGMHLHRLAAVTAGDAEP